jgi:hypothetical protein
MCSDVEMKRPTDLQAAISLAREFERRAYAIATASSVSAAWSQPRSHFPLPGPTPSTLSATTSSPVAATTGSSCSKFCRLSPEEMANKRKKGECYSCPKKFSQEHKCAMKGVFLMELIEEDDPDALADDLGISLHALTDPRVLNSVRWSTWAPPTPSSLMPLCIV